jgi:hypothetical protein
VKFALQLLIAAILFISGTLVWASFGDTPFSREVRSQLSNMPQLPRRPVTRAELNALLQDLGFQAPSAEDLPSFDVGLLRLERSWLFVSIPRKLFWIAQNLDGTAAVAEFEVAGFFWDFWHYAQLLRQINSGWRDFTMKKEGSYFDSGLQFSSQQISYQEPFLKGEWYYCFPRCFQKVARPHGRIVNRKDFPRLAFGAAADLSLVAHLK